MGLDKNKNLPFWLAGLMAIGGIGFLNIPEKSGGKVRSEITSNNEVKKQTGNDIEKKYVNNNYNDNENDDILLPVKRFLQFEKENSKSLDFIKVSFNLEGKKGNSNIDLLFNTDEKEGIIGVADKILLKPLVKDASHNISFESIIVSVPDPFGTNFKTEFDWAIDGVQKAYGVKGFTLKSFKLPVEDEKKTFSQDNKLYKKFKDNPGVLIFATPGKVNKGNKNIIEKKVAVVFLVWESPTFGVNKFSLSNAIFASARLNQYIGKEDSDTNKLRIIGPYFSGSQTVLGEVLLNLKKNGSKQFDDKKKIEDYLNNIFLTNCSALKLDYAFFEEIGVKSIQATVHHNDTVVCAIINYLKNNKTFKLKKYCDLMSDGKKIGKVALLRELNTGFGNRLFKVDKNNEKNNILTVSESVTEIPYPLSISKVDILDKNWVKKNKELSHSEIVEKRLPGQEIAFNDTFPYFDEDSLISSSGNWLRNLNDIIRREGINYIGLFGTDKRDVVYLDKFIKRNTNGIQIFCTNPNLALLHPDDSDHLRGMIVGSTYPLYPEAQKWFFKENNFEEIEEKMNFDKLFTFPSQNSNSFYNAILINSPQKSHSQFMKNYWSQNDFLGFGKIICPPIWISVVGSGGKLIPVHCYTDFLNTDVNNAYMFKFQNIEEKNLKETGGYLGFYMFPEILVILIGQVVLLKWLVDSIIRNLTNSYWWVVMCSVGLGVVNIYLFKPAIVLFSELSNLDSLYLFIKKMVNLDLVDSSNIESTVTYFASVVLIFLNFISILYFKIITIKNQDGYTNNLKKSGLNMFWFLQISQIIFILNIQFCSGDNKILCGLTLLMSLACSVMFFEKKEFSDKKFIYLMPNLLVFLGLICSWFNILKLNIEPGEWFFLSLRLSDNGSGVSPFIPMLFIGATFWIIGYFCFKIESFKSFDLGFNKLEIQGKFNIPPSLTSSNSVFFRINNQKVFSLNFIKEYGFKSTCAIFLGLYVSYIFLRFSSSSIDGIWPERIFSIMATFCVVIITWFVLQGIKIFDEIRAKSVVISRIPIINGFGKIPDGIKKIFYGNLYSKRPKPFDLDELVFTLPDGIKQFVFGGANENSTLEEKYTQGYPVLKNLREIVLKDSGIVYGRWDDQSVFKQEISRILDELFYRLFYDYEKNRFDNSLKMPDSKDKKQSNQELFYGILNDSLKEEKTTKKSEDPDTENMAFFCSYLTLKFGYSLALLRQFALATIFPSFFLLLAVSSYPFRYFDLWIVAVEIVLGQLAFFTGYILVQINKNKLFSQIMNTEPGDLTIDANFMASFGTYVLPIVCLLGLNLFGYFRFVFEPILFYIF